MNDKCAISVIIPTYNRGHLISRAISSVLAQNIHNLEIIIVDDCSTDCTEQVVNQFNHPKIKYIYLSHNSGAAHARNIGFSNSNGDLIAFLDSDDEWLTQTLETQLSTLASCPDCDAVIAGFIRFYNRSVEYIVPPNVSQSSKDLLPLLLSSNFISPQVLVIKRDCFLSLGGFDENLSHREDWDLGIRLLTNFNVRVVNLPLAIVYETPGNLTSMTLPKLSTLELIINKHTETFHKYPKILSKHYRHLGHLYIILGKFSRGRNYLLLSIKTHYRADSIFQFILSMFGAKFYQLISNWTIGLRKLKQ